MEQHAFEVKGHMAIGKKASGPIKVDQSFPRIANLPVGKCTGNPPIFSSCQKWSYAAIASLMAGVMPPSAMFGRSWL